jgi:ketosteroid isomerase-like protein
MLTPAAARAFAEEWIAAWNAHDIDRILAHYADDVRLATPFIALLGHDPTGTLAGKPALRAYWRTAFDKFPDLRFELLDVMSGIDTICVVYRSVLHLRAVEWLRLGPDGKAVEAIAHYSDIPR